MIALHISNLGRQKCFYMLRSRFVIQMTCGVPVKKPEGKVTIYRLDQDKLKQKLNRIFVKRKNVGPHRKAFKRLSDRELGCSLSTRTQPLTYN